MDDALRSLEIVLHERPGPAAAALIGAAQSSAHLSSEQLVARSSRDGFGLEYLNALLAVTAELSEAGIDLQSCLSCLPPEESALFSSLDQTALHALAGYALVASRAHLIIATALTPAVLPVLPPVPPCPPPEDLCLEELTDQCRRKAARVERELPRLVPCVPPDAQARVDAAVHGLKATKTAVARLLREPLACSRALGASAVAATLEAALLDAESAAAGATVHALREQALDRETTTEQVRETEDALVAGLALQGWDVAPPLAELRQRLRGDER